MYSFPLEPIAHGAESCLSDSMIVSWKVAKTKFGDTNLQTSLLDSLQKRSRRVDLGRNLKG